MKTHNYNPRWFKFQETESGIQVPVVTRPLLHEFGELSNREALASRIGNRILGDRYEVPRIFRPALHFDHDGDRAAVGILCEQLPQVVTSLEYSARRPYLVGAGVGQFLHDYLDALKTPPTGSAS